MVAFYKHDIPAWMNGTEDLDDRPYRVYHVICQLIYLNEGPIKINERGLAGRCKTNILAFRKALADLLEKGKLTLHPDGTLTQARADLELTHIATNRVHARLGGEARAKALEKLKSDEAVAQRYPALRLEETREERKKDAAPPPQLPLLALVPPKPKSLEEQAKTEFYRDFKTLIGPKSGGMASKLVAAKGGNIFQAITALAMARDSGDPLNYIGGIIRSARPASAII